MKKLFLPFLLLLFASLAAQETDHAKLEQIASRLLTDIRATRQNYLFAHLDKPYYMAGTTLWFRIYLASVNTHNIGAGVKTVYAGLYNKEGMAINKVLLNAEELQLNGGIQIPPDLAEGYYFFRAAAGNSYLFTPFAVVQPIYVVNNLQKNSLSETNKISNSKKAKDSALIQFFPEGGNLISGVENTVIVFATGTDGKPASVNGTVSDHLGNSITKFTTSSNGFGKFVFNPSRPRRYSVHIREAETSGRVYPLPATSDTAYQLALVKNDAGYIKFRVNLGDVLYAKKAKSFLLGFSKDSLVFAGIGTGMYEAEVSKSKIPGGIADFFLFNEKMEQVSHRKVWIDPADVNLTISADKERYGPRSKVQLKIAVTDKSNSPVPALLSVAVTDDNALLQATDTNFLRKLILSPRRLINSHCAGEVAVSFNEETDILMSSPEITEITVRRDSFLNIEKLPDSKISLKGILKEKNKALAGETLNIFPYPAANTIMKTATDEKGYFEIKDLNFYDSTVFALQPENTRINIEDVTITLQESGFQVLPTIPDFSACITEMNNERIEAFKKATADTFLTGSSKTMLEEIVLRSVKGKKTSEKKGNKLSRTITREQLQKQGLSTTANAVMMVPGVVMMNGKLTIRGGMPTLSPDLAGASQEPIVVIDGVPASTGNSVIDFLNSIPPEQIEEIEVLTGPEGAQYGSRAGNGVILIKTGLPQFLSGKKENMVIIRPKGYHVSPEFYIPDYSNEKVRYAGFKDNRSTIYWNGDVFVGKEPLSLSFYTADTASTYTVTIMGITDKGAIIYKKTKINRN